MMGSQIILSIIIFFIILKTFRSYLIKKISSAFFILWLFFWLAVLFLIHYTAILSSIAKLLGIGRGVDLAIYTSIILIFYLLYVLFVRISEIEKKIEKIVRKEALKDIKNKT